MSGDKIPQRDYGLDDQGVPLGAPVASPLPADADCPHECPHCGCAQLQEVQVRMKHPLIRGGEGICRYVGCPACPWASPAVIVPALGKIGGEV